MTGRFKLPFAFSYRCAFFILSLITAIVAPSGMRAQDVVALPTPPSTNSETTPEASIAIFDIPTTPTLQSEAAEEIVPESMAAPQLVRAPDFRPDVADANTVQPTAATTSGVVTTTPRFDVADLQCKTDADCVIAENGCTDMAAVGRMSVAHWKSVMVHDPACKPVFDLAKVQRVIDATCREGWCGLQPKNRPQGAQAE